MADAQVLTGVSASITTIDATPVNILKLPILDNATNKVNIQVVAREVGLDDSRMWDDVVLIDRTDGGMPSMIGTLVENVPSVGEVGSALWTIGVVFDATDAFIQVTGEAGGEINWFCSVDIVYVCEV